MPGTKLLYDRGPSFEFTREHRNQLKSVLGKKDRGFDEFLNAILPAINLFRAKKATIKKYGKLPRRKLRNKFKSILKDISRLKHQLENLEYSFEYDLLNSIVHSKRESNNTNMLQRLLEDLSIVEKRIQEALRADLPAMEKSLNSLQPLRSNSELLKGIKQSFRNRTIRRITPELGRQPKEEECELIKSIAYEYQNAFGKWPSSSREGKFTYFVSDILQVIGATDDTSSSAYRLVKRAIG